MNRNRTRLLGECLVANGLITQEQLERALQRQRMTRRFLGEILLELGWVDEQSLLKALGEQFGIAFVHWGDVEVDWQAVERFSVPDLAEHTYLPLAMSPSSVRIAVSNPLDAWVIGRLETQAGYRTVELVLMTKTDIEKGWREFTKHNLLKGKR
jgi:type IV pilus assembly protein PilB